MNYNLLGSTGVFVSDLCLGTMTVGGQGYWEVMGKLDADNATALVRAFHEAGGNFIDTADGYGFGRSEEYVGQALQNVGVDRAEWVLATKVFLRMGPGVNNVGLSRKHIAEGVNGSLRRLQTDYIDLYQIHGFDPVTPIEETLRGLEDVVRSGKVRYLGISNQPAWMIAKANGLAREMGLTPFVTTQNYYSLAGRDLEHEILPFAQDAKMAVLPWSPQAGGFLSGKFRRDKTSPEDARRAKFNFPPVDTNLAFDLVDAMADIAREIDATVAQVALAALLRQPGITSVIIGAKNVTQLQDNLGASDVRHRLTDAHLQRLDAISKPEKMYPYWMMERQNAARMPGTSH